MPLRPGIVVTRFYYAANEGGNIGNRGSGTEGNQDRNAFLPARMNGLDGRNFGSDNQENSLNFACLTNGRKSRSRESSSAP